MGMGGGGGRGEVTSDINVTPMADVMLVLLIIFMVITPMLQKGISSVELAKTKNPTEMTEADKEDSVLVSIARDGKFYLNQDRVNIDDLSANVRGATACGWRGIHHLDPVTTCAELRRLGVRLPVHFTGS